MARRSIVEPEVQHLIGDLSWLYVHTGSIAALAAALNTRLQDIGETDKLVWNRVAAILTDDPAKGINDKTFDLLRRAVKAAPIPKPKAPVEVPPFCPPAVQRIIGELNAQRGQRASARLRSVLTPEVIGDIQAQIDNDNESHVVVEKNIAKALISVAEAS